MTGLIDEIGSRLARGEALTREDALGLWAAPDLVRLGMLADDVRRRMHGQRATFVRVLDVDIETVTDTTVPAMAGEVRVVGSARAMAAHLDDLARLVSRSEGAPVTVGALEEWQSLPAGERQIVYRQLREVGVHGVASAAVDRLEHMDAAVKAVTDTGLSVARFVVSRGQGSSPHALLDRVGALQQATGAVRAFAPLARAVDPAQPSTGYDDVRAVALARLVLGSVTSIQVDWALHGPKLAQVALLFGADDVDAVSTADDVGTGRRRAPLEEIRRNMVAAALQPVERDGRFVARDNRHGA